MARKKSVKNEDQEEFEVDEPSEVDEGTNEEAQNDNSGEGGDTKPSGGGGGGGGGRRTSGRARTVKKPYRGDDSSPDEEGDDDAESEEEKKPKKRAGGGAGGGTATRGGGGRGRGRGARAKPPPKKQKVEEENEDSEEEEGDESEGDAADTPAEFRSGCFVALKTDIDNKVENHPVWKIDGKSLLQKFDKFTHEGETLYKSTTIYAGWSKTILETYYSIKVEYKKVPGHESCVKFDPSQFAHLAKENNKEVKEETKEEKKDNNEDGN